MTPPDTGGPVSPDSGAWPRAPGRWPTGSTGSRSRCRWTGSRRSTSTRPDGDDGLTLIDGGWAIPRRATRSTSACATSAPGSATSGGSWSPTSTATTTRWRPCSATSTAPTSPSAPAKPGLDRAATTSTAAQENPFSAGAGRRRRADVIGGWLRAAPRRSCRTRWWALPDTWLDGDLAIDVGARTLDAVHTPGHTPGTTSSPTGPTGCSSPATTCCRRSRRRSASPCRPARPARRLHGVAHQGARSCPTCGSCPRTAGRAVLARPGRRAARPPRGPPRVEPGRARVRASSRPGRRAGLAWTRHERAYDDLDVFNRGMAAMETKAHLELLVARGSATCEVTDEGVLGFAAAP